MTFCFEAIAAAIPPKPEPIIISFINYKFNLNSINIELIFFNSALVSSRFFIKKIVSFDLSTDVVMIFYTDFLLLF